MCHRHYPPIPIFPVPVDISKYYIHVEGDTYLILTTQTFPIIIFLLFEGQRGGALITSWWKALIQGNMIGLCA